VGGQLVGGEPFMGNEIAGRHPQNKLIYQWKQMKFSIST
jgi:hypothetical protein